MALSAYIYMYENWMWAYIKVRSDFKECQISVRKPMTLSGGNCMTRRLVATTITVQEHKLQFGINQKMQRLSLLLNYRYVLSIIMFFVLFSVKTQTLEVL